MSTLQTHSLTDTKNNFSAYTVEANATGRSFIVEKQGKPWVRITPLQHGACEEKIIEPSKRDVFVADIDCLFEKMPSSFVPEEDGFAHPAGSEVL